MTSAQLEEKFAELEQRLLEKIAKLIVNNKPVKSEPPPIKLTDRKKLPKMPRGVTVFKEPQEGRKYFIGADIGEGLGGSCDDSAFSVVEAESSGKIRQVAWYSSNEVDPYEFAGILDAVGRIYFDAVLAPEVNRYDSTLYALRNKYGYPNFNRWWTIDSVNSISSKIGWVTTVATESRMRHHFRSLMKRKMIEINDPECRRCFTEWYENKQSYDLNELKTLKDDHMKALMIAAVVAGEV